MIGVYISSVNNLIYDSAKDDNAKLFDPLIKIMIYYIECLLICTLQLLHTPIYSVHVCILLYKRPNKEDMMLTNET